MSGGVHARWVGANSALCGTREEQAVLIRMPEDWEMVTCPGCHYAAERNER